MGEAKAGAISAFDLRADLVFPSALRLKGSGRWLLWRHFPEPVGAEAAMRSAVAALRGDCLDVGDRLLMAEGLTDASRKPSPYMSGRCDVRFMQGAPVRDMQSRDWGLLLSFDGAKREPASWAATYMQDWKDKSLASKQVGKEPVLRPAAVEELGLPRKIPALFPGGAGANATFGPLTVLTCRESELEDLFKDPRLCGK